MSNERFKISIDRRTNKVVHISDVPEGFIYGICPDCKSELVASNRNIKDRKITTYFRHKTTSSCQGETLVHLWAKQVIAVRNAVFSADYTAVGKANDLARKPHLVELIQAAEQIEFIHVNLEQQIFHGTETRTPDLMCETTTGVDLAIEIFVNNAVKPQKESFYVSKQLDCLEIDLSNLPPHLVDSPNAFETYVLSGAPRKWINCTRYDELDLEAERQAKALAKQASDTVNTRRERKRKIKVEWRYENKTFLYLVESYLEPANQIKVQSLYQEQLQKVGTLSNSYKQWFYSNFGGIPDIINLQVKGELGFKCHRSVWQWEIYQRAVLDTWFKCKHGIKQPAKLPRTARGYEDAYLHLAWYDYAPKWSPLTLYESIKGSVPLTRICIETERIAGEPIISESNKLDSFAGLKFKEWDALPKPVCVIRRYIKELMSRSILEPFGEDTYVVPQEARLPLIYDVSALNLELSSEHRHRIQKAILARTE